MLTGMSRVFLGVWSSVSFLLAPLGPCSHLRAEGSSPAVHYLWILFREDFISEKPDSWRWWLTNVDRLVIYSCWGIVVHDEVSWGNWSELNCFTVFCWVTVIHVWLFSQSQYEVICFTVCLLESWLIQLKTENTLAFITPGGKEHWVVTVIISAPLKILHSLTTWCFVELMKMASGWYPINVFLLNGSRRCHGRIIISLDRHLL